MNKYEIIYTKNEKFSGHASDDYLFPRQKDTLREECPYSELFWSVFSRIRIEYGEIQISLRIQSECGKIRTRISPNTDALRKDKIAKRLIKLASDALSVVAALSLWVNIEINKSFQSKKRFLLLLSFYSMLATR